MKKTNFAEIMQQNGFQYTGKTSYDGQFIFGREWRKTSNVLWYGEMESSFRIEAYESYGYLFFVYSQLARLLRAEHYQHPNSKSTGHTRRNTRLRFHQPTYTAPDFQ